MEAVGFSEVVGVLGALWMSLKFMGSIKMKVERSSILCCQSQWLQE